MTDLLRKTFAEHIARSLPARLGDGWHPVERKGKHFALFLSEGPGSDFFIAFYWQPRSARFFVELGWISQSESAIPTANPGVTSSQKLDQNNASAAIRLFWLCSNRGRAEQFWDLFSTQVWDENVEDFSRFRSRMIFDSADEELRVLEAGGPTKEYAERKSELIGDDVMTCLARFGLPFLDAVRMAKLEGLPSLGR